LRITYYVDWLVEQGLTSHSTQFRSFRRQCQSTEGRWLVIQIALNLTRLISPCYNNTICMHIQDNDTQRNLSTVIEPSEILCIQHNHVFTVHRNTQLTFNISMRVLPWNGEQNDQRIRGLFNVTRYINSRLTYSLTYAKQSKRKVLPEP